MVKRKDDAVKALEKLSYDELLTLAARVGAAKRAAEKAGAAKPNAKVKVKSGGIDWTKEEHTCPKCGHKGMVDPDFGYRVVRGVERKQSWCTTCRATTSYYDKPRKNLSR